MLNQMPKNSQLFIWTFLSLLSYQPFIIASGYEYSTNSDLKKSKQNSAAAGYRLAWLPALIDLWRNNWQCQSTNEPWAICFAGLLPLAGICSYIQQHGLSYSTKYSFVDHHLWPFPNNVPVLPCGSCSWSPTKTQMVGTKLCFTFYDKWGEPVEKC